MDNEKFLTDLFQDKVVLTKREVGKVLGISESTINRLLKNKQFDQLPGFKRIGNKTKAKYIFPMASVLVFLDKTTEYVRVENDENENRDFCLNEHAIKILSEQKKRLCTIRFFLDDIGCERVGVMINAFEKVLRLLERINDKRLVRMLLAWSESAEECITDFEVCSVLRFQKITEYARSYSNG